MKKILPLVFLFFLLLIPISLAAPEAANPRLELVDPVVKGNSVTIDMNIFDVTLFDGAGPLTIRYDPTSLELKEVIPAEFAPEIGVTLNLEKGLFLLNLPGTGGKTGSGIISTMIFEVVQPPKASEIQIMKVVLSNNQGITIESPSETNIVYFIPDVEPECSEDAECQDGYKCVDGVCFEIIPDPDPDPDPDPEPDEPAPYIPPAPIAAAPVPLVPEPEVEEEQISTTAEGEKNFIQRVIFNFYFIILLILIVLLVGGYFTYKHFKRVQKERSEKDKFQSQLQMPGSVSTEKKPVAVEPVAKPIPAQPVKPVPVKPVSTGDPGIDYIKSCRTQGFTDDQIKAELKKQGWSDQDILQKMVKAK